MQCPVCHNEVTPGTSFCNHCGAPLAAASGAAPAGAVAPVPTYAVQPAATAASSGLSDTAAAAISYITIIPAIIFLVLEPYNKKPFVRFHSFQSIGLCVAWIAIWIAMMILQIVLHFIPLIGILFVILNMCIGLGFFIIWIIAILKASKGEWYKLPVIGDFAMKQANS
jgi:uncharacterized membrane protein